MLFTGASHQSLTSSSKWEGGGSIDCLPQGQLYARSSHKYLVNFIKIPLFVLFEECRTSYVAPFLKKKKILFFLNNLLAFHLLQKLNMYLLTIVYTASYPFFHMKWRKMCGTLFAWIRKNNKFAIQCFSLLLIISNIFRST